MIRIAVMRGTVVAPDAKMPGTAEVEDTADETGRARSAKVGHLPVSELVADRAAAPSPFGDDQTFPLPVDELSYIPTITTP
jgi:hypothetical protein